MSGRRGREQGFDDLMVNHSHWITAALFAARSLPKGWTGMGEDLRLALTAAGLREPAHHNAWGALVMALLRGKVLEDTGDIGQMNDPSSHARKSTIYRKAR